MEGESLFNDATAIVLFQGKSAVLVAYYGCELICLNMAREAARTFTINDMLGAPMIRDAALILWTITNLAQVAAAIPKHVRCALACSATTNTKG